MGALITKAQAAEYLGLKTPEAADKLLTRLGVRKINFALIGSKGVRYRRSEIDEALTTVEVGHTEVSQKKKAKKKTIPDFCTLSIKEQRAFLTESGPGQ